MAVSVSPVCWHAPMSARLATAIQILNDPILFISPKVASRRLLRLSVLIRSAASPPLPGPRYRQGSSPVKQSGNSAKAGSRTLGHWAGFVLHVREICWALTLSDAPRRNAANARPPPSCGDGSRIDSACCLAPMASGLGNDRSHRCAGVDAGSGKTSCCLRNSSLAYDPCGSAVTLARLTVPRVPLAPTSYGCQSHDEALAGDQFALRVEDVHGYCRRLIDVVVVPAQGIHPGQARWVRGVTTT